MRTRLTFVFCLVFLVVPLAIAGCGSSNNDTTAASGSGGKNLTATPGINEPKSPEVANKVPKSVASTGTLTVAADATYAPDEFVGNGTVEGMDADLAKAIAQEMGLKPDVKNIPFDSIIPGLAANKYDLGMSSFTITKERLKTVDFVSYAQAGTSFYVKAQGGSSVTSLDQLCGKTAAAEKGTTQADDIASQDKKCKAQGKPGVTGQIFPDQNGVNLAVQSGRADVGMADSPVVDYAVQQSNGQLKLSGKPYGEALYGIAMPKGNGMAPAVLEAVKELMADGVYDKIFSYWGLDDGKIDNPQINPQNVPAN